MCRASTMVTVAFITAIVISLTPVSAAREFPDTGYSIADDRLLNYFDHRGGVRVFGQPISREFIFMGTRVQIFERLTLQQRADGSVGVLNVLDSGLLPLIHAAGCTFPPPDPDLVKAAPLLGQPDYADRALEFVQANVPDEWDGARPTFYQTFLSTVSMDDAFPDGEGNDGLLALANLEIWGLPTSKPARDPNNAAFIYQRFQLGIMVFNSSSGNSWAVPTGEHLKAVLTGQGLRGDLAADARGSKTYLQYDNGMTNGVSRPTDLPASGLFAAFERDGVEVPTPAPSPTPTQTPVPVVPTATPTEVPTKPEWIAVEGSEWFVTQTQSALGLLPDTVRDSVWKIVETHGNCSTDYANHTLYVTEAVAFPYELRTNPDGQIQWYAGLIMHNAAHIEQYFSGRPSQGTAAEKEAQMRQKVVISAVDTTEGSRFTNRMSSVLSNDNVAFSCWQPAP
jgi:hypothetical protein